MKRLKKILLVVPIALCILLLAGCESKKEDEVTLTVAQTLASQFETEIKSSSLEDAMKKISENDVIQTNVEVAKVVDGTDYISGFSTEITGYKDGYAIRPFIGSIPFVAYAFEVEDAKAFEKTLTDNADLRWNICTEADSIETAIYNNYVFVVLAPDSFEE